MLKVYTFGPKWDLLDPSPFCTKLLAYLNLAGVEYERVSGMQHIRSSPKGKMPFIRDGAQIIGDSNLIAVHLKHAHGVDLDAHLTPSQRAISHAVGRMLDENTYWCLLFGRWLDDANWERHTKPALFGRLPLWQRVLLPGVLRKQIRRSARAQGMARHTPQEIAEIGIRDFQCLIDLLRDQDFMFGGQPAAVDAAAYAMCTAMISVPHEGPINQFVRESPLVAYTQRVAARF